MILYLIAAIIFVEAVVEIEVESELFAGFRNKLAKIRNKHLGWYLNGLFSCGYCLSVWVSAIVSLVIPVVIIDKTWIGGILDIGWLAPIVDFVFKVFIIHRFSNIWHELIHRWLSRIPYILAFRPSTDEVTLPGSIEENPNDITKGDQTKNGDI